MKYCKGSGHCLTLMDNNLYKCIKDNTIICSHNCQPVKCENYLICNHEFPDWTKYSCNCCTACILKFMRWNTPILTFTDNIKCSMCYDITKNVSLQSCNHTLCIPCFKQYYYDDEFKCININAYSKDEPVCPICNKGTGGLFD